MSVLPRRDIVSLVDKHGGNIQSIACTQSSVIDCHFISGALCELATNCGLSKAANRTFIDCICTSANNEPQDCF